MKYALKTARCYDFFVGILVFGFKKRNTYRERTIILFFVIRLGRYIVVTATRESSSQNDEIFYLSRIQCSETSEFKIISIQPKVNNFGLILEIR